MLTLTIHRSFHVMQVAFLRMWFAENEVDQFTVSLWFKRDGIQTGSVGLVNNGDCEEDPNFEVTASENGVYSGVTTSTQVITTSVTVRRIALSRT